MEYEGKIELKLAAHVTVEGLNREDAKQKLERLHKRLVEFLERDDMVDEVYSWNQESYVYTDENWKPTPRLNDETFLVYENEGDRDYFTEYYDGDETRIEDAVRSSEETELSFSKRSRSAKFISSAASSGATFGKIVILAIVATRRAATRRVTAT